MLGVRIVQHPVHWGGGLFLPAGLAVWVQIGDC